MKSFCRSPNFRANAALLLAFQPHRRGQVSYHPNCHRSVFAREFERAYLANSLLAVAAMSLPWWRAPSSSIALG